MDGGVGRPILCCAGGVLIIIKDGLNAFPIRQGDLASWVDSVRNTEGPAAAVFRNEALTQPAANRLQGYDKLLYSGRSTLRARTRTNINIHMCTHIRQHCSTAMYAQTNKSYILNSLLDNV